MNKKAFGKALKKTAIQLGLVSLVITYVITIYMLTLRYGDWALVHGIGVPIVLISVISIFINNYYDEVIEQRKMGQ